MARKNIEVSLKTSDNMLLKKMLAIVTDDSIKYNDDNVKVSLKFNNDNVIMIRENNEYRLQLEFDSKNKKIGSYLLKLNNMTFDLDIITNKLVIDKNNIYIVYELNDEVREYNLSIKE